MTNKPKKCVILADGMVVWLKNDAEKDIDCYWTDREGSDKE